MTKLLPEIERGRTWTNEHLRRCLCRWIAARPKVDRIAFFEAWQKRHGRASAAALHAEVKAEWQRLNS